MKTVNDDIESFRVLWPEVFAFGGKSNPINVMTLLDKDVSEGTSGIRPLDVDAIMPVDPANSPVNQGRLRLTQARGDHGFEIRVIIRWDAADGHSDIGQGGNLHGKYDPAGKGGHMPIGGDRNLEP
jgi:hypothetical protein